MTRINNLLSLTTLRLLLVWSHTDTFTFVNSWPVSGIRHKKWTSSLALSSKYSTTNNNLESLSVCIVGAGPCGLLAAHRLAQMGANVQLLEGRPKSNATSADNGRAYALGIGRRGRTSIKSVDAELWNAVKAQGFASERFDLHLPFGFKLRLRNVGDGEQPEQGRVVEPSILLYQNDLCNVMVDELERRYMDNPNVQIDFDERVQTVELSKQQLTTSSGRTIHFDLVLGCDGVNSVVRQALDKQWTAFETVREPIPGHYKVVRLDSIPPNVDPSAVSLLLPKAGAITAFIEPTKLGSCCILFAGNNASDPLLSSSNTTELEELMSTRWPKLGGADLNQAARQLAAAQETFTASLVKCNTFSYSHKTVLLGDAAHATGGVSGQGVNSALVDAMALADMLDKFYDSSAKETSLQKTLLEYSIQQVPEAKALFDLSFGPRPNSVVKRITLGLTTLRDSIFKGRFGIGKMPLQTKLATSLIPFRAMRKERDAYYDESFPSDTHWREILTKLDATVG
jgi:kynurenine 3-monooxygenase